VPWRASLSLSAQPAALYDNMTNVPGPSLDSGYSARQRPLVLAHRGGAGLWPENTMYAFERAVQMGVDVLEIDIHATAEGELVIIHDPTVDRTTGGMGEVKSLGLVDVRGLDAGYRWSSDGGKSFPFRGQGIRVPTLREAFAAFPDTRFNIDIKQDQPSVASSFCELIHNSRMEDRVMVASFKQEVLDEFRSRCGGVATSASVADVQTFLARETAAANAQSNHVPGVLQVPEYSGGRQLLTRELVDSAHRHGVEVHAWTINDEASMARMLDLGVDGIITDFPDKLLALLNRAR
jgi:glycerophosphoryl diester phosphodiesterase